MPSFLYCGLTLDRAHALRRDTEALESLLAAPTLRVLPLWQGQVLVDAAARALWLTGDAAAGLRGRAVSEVLLGQDGDAVWLAMDLPGHEAPDIGTGGTFRPLRQLGAALPGGDAALLAYAKGMLHWHSRHRHCGVCGNPTESRAGGATRLCSTCGAEHFPRTDPAVIVLVHDGDRCLLHRQPHWPAGMWSVLAGFVEPGESLEETVAREVHEETGVVVDSVRYLGSQPWPFPSSVMVAFAARYAGGELTLDRHELEDARWFSRDEILAFDGETRFLPRRDSIARWMVEEWLGR